MLLDKKQKEIDVFLKEIASSISSKNFFKSIKNLFVKSRVPKGVYMYGGVGRGKTMLMKRFYSEASCSKEIIHFQKFMQDLHIKIHTMRKGSKQKLISNLANEIAKRSKIVCMDEFEIKDITDAMIIMRLFKYLIQNNVFIFVTTNIKPKNLYKDGIQRESFLPFISMIQDEFEVVHLDIDKDYRYDFASSIKNRIIFPFGKESACKIQSIKDDICNKDEMIESYLETFGRQMFFKHTHQDILFTNFNELFERDFGYADYVNICEHFKIIVLEKTRLIAEDEVNIITRFINFIDNAYFNKVQLFIESEDVPEKIYLKGNKLKEFTRTISRLNEMNSSEYLKNKTN